MNPLHSEHNGEHVPGLPSLSLAEFEAMLRRIVEEAVKRAVRVAMKPEMATLREIADDYCIKDTRTVVRRCERYNIPVRNIHGGIWREGDGRKLISRSEWTRKAPSHTRSVKKIVREEQRHGQMKRTRLQSALNALPESAKIVEIKTTKEGTLVRYREGRSRLLEMLLAAE